MNILLDTHTFLWFAWGNKQLSQHARSLIESDEHVKYVSMASIREMAIKLNLGKLQLARPFGDFLMERVDGNGFEVLPNGSKPRSAQTGSHHSELASCYVISHQRNGFRFPYPLHGPMLRNPIQICANTRSEIWHCASGLVGSATLGTIPRDDKARIEVYQSSVFTWPN